MAHGGLASVKARRRKAQQPSRIVQTSTGPEGYAMTRPHPPREWCLQVSMMSSDFARPDQADLRSDSARRRRSRQLAGAFLGCGANLDPSAFSEADLVLLQRAWAMLGAPQRALVRDAVQGEEILAGPAIEVLALCIDVAASADQRL